MADLTHEQLGLLVACPSYQLHPAMHPLVAAGLAETNEPDGRWAGRYELTPAGQALVSIALRAVNAELRSRE